MEVQTTILRQLVDHQDNVIAALQDLCDDPWGLFEGESDEA